MTQQQPCPEQHERAPVQAIPDDQFLDMLLADARFRKQVGVERTQTASDLKALSFAEKLREFL